MRAGEMVELTQWLGVSSAKRWFLASHSSIITCDDCLPSLHFELVLRSGGQYSQQAICVDHRPDFRRRFSFPRHD